MDLKSLLLVIINRLDGERTIYSGLHLLRGKRSGQTLQDVKYYNLKPFFGLLPKITKENFDKTVEKLLQTSSIVIGEDAIVRLTKSGREEETNLSKFHFNGWDYRGAEQLFFARLSLFIQTISHFRVGEKSFLPTQRDREIQLFTRDLLHGQPITNPDFALLIKDEIQLCMEISKISKLQKTIIIHRLGGFGQTGWTWSQLSEELQMSIETLHLLFIESLHMLLDEISLNHELPYLTKVAKNIKVSSYLTDSSRKTKQLYNTGKSIDEICVIRNLKRSTIEDHFVEFSSNETDFKLAHFISSPQMELVLQKVEELGTKRLRILKDEFPSLTYFQLRLVLGFHSRGEGK